MDSTQQDQEILPQDQKLSSEENYSPDYEMFSKKPEKKFPLLWVITGVVLFLIILFTTLYFTGVLSKFIKF